MKCVATITSKFGNHGYYGLPVPRVEAYTIDSAMDTDADSFSIDIGDPNSDLIRLFKRDSEVRVSLSATFDNRNFVPLLRGYADSIALTHDGSLSLQGRDLSAAAIDDTAIPYNWRTLRPEKLIVDHARQRGFSQFRGALGGKGSITPFRVFYTDGSESEWAMWYRMVRERKMWLWVDPIGALYADKLNYAASPTYYFGEPDEKRPNFSQWIRVMEAELHKNTQTRIYEVWVFGDTGNASFAPVKINDPKIRDWIKKPLHIVSAQAGVTNVTQATKEAHEELFEGMVGELEILIRVSDPGFIIRQNTTCYLNLPKMGYAGEFFVVGVRILGGTTGYIQEVRLREKKYALSRRIPADPILADDTQNFSTSALGGALGISKPNWGEYFVIAAKAFHGGWDFSLFLAALLAICDAETSFTNVRETASGFPSGIEWYPKPLSGNTQARHRHGEATTSQHTIQEWHADFANSKGNSLNPFNWRTASGGEAGVGPMQLTDLDAKLKADDKFGLRDEYAGGRWQPASNIWAGAWKLSKKLEGLPQNESNFWKGIQAYNGSGPAAVAYGKRIEAAVKTTYLPAIQQAEVAAGATLPANSTKTLKKLGPFVPDAIKRVINYAERQLGDAYKLGASGPDSYDCSGLVWASYNAAGLSGDIGGRKTTWGYWGSHSVKAKPISPLKYIPVDQLAIGDMVFFNIFGSDQNPPQHMGIYYGDNQMIVAPHSGDVVKIEGISAPAYWDCLGGLRDTSAWPAGADNQHNPGPN